MKVMQHVFEVFNDKYFVTISKHHITYFTILAA